MRPVIAMIFSTASPSPMPAELAWQVSRQNPILSAPPTTSHSRAMWSSVRAMAPSPPAVFSISSGIGRGIWSTALAQLSSPSCGSSLAVTCPPCTTRPFAPTDAAALSCCLMMVLLGCRMRLLVLARFTGYGEWM